jgi:hypothetical protein
MTKRARTHSKRKEGQASNAQSGRGFGEWADWLSSLNPFGNGQPYDPFGAPIWKPSQGWGSSEDKTYAWDVVNPTILKAMLLTSARFAASALYPKKAPYPAMSQDILARSLLKDPNFWKRIAIGMPATLAALGFLMEPVNGEPPPSWVVLPAGLAMMSWHMYQALPGNRDEDNSANGQPPPPYAPSPVPLQPALPSVVQPAVQSEAEQKEIEAAALAARREAEFLARARGSGRQSGLGKKRKQSHNFSKLAKTCLCPTKKLRLSLRP